MGKVAYASRHWSNGKGYNWGFNPKFATVNGCQIHDEPALAHPNFPDETCYERAVRLGIIDVWVPVVTFYFANSHSLTYKGEKALELWKAWNARIFSKKKEKK